MTDSEKDLAGGSRSCATERGGARSCATEGGGARSCATEGGVVVADARERVPPGLAHGTLGSPAGGSLSCATDGDTSLPPPAKPKRNGALLLIIIALISEYAKVSFVYKGNKRFGVEPNNPFY